MKKHFKTIKKFIATLLLATILSSSITSNLFLPSDTINVFSEEDHRDTPRFPRS